MAGVEGSGGSGSERRDGAGELAPCDSSEADDDPWPYQGQFGFEMIAAVRDLGGARIAIAALRVARITPDQVGDKNPAQPHLPNHPPQQIAGAVAAERDTGAITAETARRDSNERDPRDGGAGAGNHARTGSHQRRTADASEHRGAHPGQPLPGVTEV